ncbi:hypothetical protein SK128_019703, partial [Halocaridina rubra]
VKIGQEYRRLDKNYERAKEEDEKDEYMQMILLLIVLYLQYTQQNLLKTWKSYLTALLKVLDVICEEKPPPEEYFKWVESFISKIQGNTPDNISDEFYKLFYTIQKYCNPDVPDNIESNEFCKPELISKALLISSEQNLPLFLYMLVSIAEVDVNLVVNHFCNSTPLHHAARFNNMSAIAYLLQRGAKFQTDRSGFLPHDYAYMFGHNKTGNYLAKEDNKTSEMEDTEDDELSENEDTKGEESENSGGIIDELSKSEDGEEQECKSTEGVSDEINKSKIGEDDGSGSIGVRNGRELSKLNTDVSKDDDGEESEIIGIRTDRLLKKSNTNVNNFESPFIKNFQKYLRQYDLKCDRKSKSRHFIVRTHNELLDYRLEHQKRKWENKGIQKAVSKITVDSVHGEAAEVKAAVSTFLDHLKREIALSNELYDGDLEFVGSSEDNVRLYCPDEYDCNLILKNIGHSVDDMPSVNLIILDTQTSLLEGYKQRIDVTFPEKLKNLMRESEFLKEFYKLTGKGLKSLNTLKLDTRLKLILPGIKKTQVGVNLSFAWNGLKYPMLLVDVDFVPTLRVPWPKDLSKPILVCDDIDQVVLNSLGKDKWRFSFGQLEAKIMKNLTEQQKLVYLASKMILANLKTEKWVPQYIKCEYEYWQSRFFSLSAKGGFALKNSFFRELEDVKDPQEWEIKNILKRMRSIFGRMCKFDENDDAAENASSKNNDDGDATRVQAYFGGETEKASIYECAPRILKFLRDLNELDIIKEIPAE